MSKISRGFIWSFIERFSTQGISFALSIILARLIAPESYGLIVLIQVFISISQIFIDGGFYNALIQKKDRSEIDFHTVFLFNLVAAFVLYALLYLGAPYISSFYDDEKLILVTRVISINLVLNSLSIVQRTKLTIEYNFKTLSKASLISTIASGIVGVICAYNGMEVWALVVQAVLLQALQTILLSIYCKWRPQLVFSVESFKQLFKFGSKLLINSLITQLYLDLYNLIIGKFYSSSLLAYYNRGFKLSSFASVNIMDVMNRVIYPAECELQDNFSELKKAYLKYLHFSNFVTLPILLLFCILSKPLIVVLLTEKWIGMDLYFKIFCLNFLMYPWLNQATNTISALGRSDLLMKTMIYRRILSFAILAVTINFGVVTICIGILVCTLLELIILLYTQNKIFKVSIYEQFSSMWKLIANLIVMSIVAFIIASIFNNPYLQLFVGGGIACLVYLLGTIVLGLPEDKVIYKIINIKR